MSRPSGAHSKMGRYSPHPTRRTRAQAIPGSGCRRSDDSCGPGGPGGRRPAAGGNVGTTTKDVFKFTGCRRGGCAKVKLDRDGGDHSHYKSTLNKVRRGVYKGTEGPYPYSCPGSPAATFTAKHTVKVTKVKDGKATAIGGSSKVKIANCGIASFVNYTLKGKIKP